MAKGNISPPANGGRQQSEALGKIRDADFMGQLDKSIDDYYDSKGEPPVNKVFAHEYKKTDWNTIVDDYLKGKMSEAEMSRGYDDNSDGIERYIRQNGKIQSVDTGDLRPTQPWLGESLGIAYNYDSNGTPPAVIHIVGTNKYYLANGHHRAVAAILNGKEKMKAYVIDANIPKLK